MSDEEEEEERDPPGDTLDDRTCEECDARFTPTWPDQFWCPHCDWKCVTCGAALGPSNPRQLCMKTWCDETGPLARRDRPCGASST